MTLNYIPFEKMTKEQIDAYYLIQSKLGELQATDYKAIKYAEGLISEEEYKLIREQRQAWRDEINSLEQHLNIQ